MWRRGTLSRDSVADRWTPKCVRHLTGPPSIVFLQQMISVTRLRASLAAFILWRAGFLRTTKAVTFCATQLNKKDCEKRQSSLLAALCRGAKDAPPIQCGRGGIGRRAALRSLWGNSRGSSSLLDRTNLPLLAVTLTGSDLRLGHHSPHNPECFRRICPWQVALCPDPLERPGNASVYASRLIRLTASIGINI